MSLPTTGEMDASLVVVLQTTAPSALRCLTALAGLPELPEHEVVIVDDGAVGLDAVLGRVDGETQVIRHAQPAGFAASANEAAARASGRRIVLLRGEPEVSPGFLAPLLAALDDPACAGAAAVPPGGGAGAHPVQAQAIAVRREDFAAAGGVPGLPDELAIAGLVAALARRGPVTPVAASIVAPRGARSGGARGHLGAAPELSVVVPTLDVTSPRVRSCLAAVQARTDVPHELIVIDNGAAPQGFTAPVNAGLRAARGDYLVVMNDDVEVTSGWWEPLRETLRAGAAVAFPLTVHGAMRDDFAAWCFALDRDTLEAFAVAPGEFFDPALRVWYQDTDLLARLRAAGRPPVLCPDSRITHGLSETVASSDPELRAWVQARIREDKAVFEARWGVPGAAAVSAAG